MPSRGSVSHERQQCGRDSVQPGSSVGGGGAGPLAMEASSLRKDFRLGRGQVLHAVRDVSLQPLPRRGRRAGRRERLGQVDRGQAARRAGAADLGRRSGSTASRSTCPAGAPSAATRARCSWSSRTRSPRSTPCTRCATTSSGRSGCTSASRFEGRGGKGGRCPARAGAPDAGRAVPRQVPARAVRRPAPAGLLRPGARRAARRAARRRAGLDAGRLDPARDAEPAR